MKTASVKISALTGHQEVKNLWNKSEKHSFSGAVVVALFEGGLSWFTLLAGLGTTPLLFECERFYG
jgi:hypothetical protein